MTILIDRAAGDADPAIGSMKAMQAAGDMVGRAIRTRIKALRDEHGSARLRARGATPTAVQ